MTHLLFDPKEKWCGVTMPEKPKEIGQWTHDKTVLEIQREYFGAEKKAISQKIPVRSEDQSRVTMILQQDKLVLHEPEEGYLYPIPAGVELEVFEDKSNFMTEFGELGGKKIFKQLLRLKEPAKQCPVCNGTYDKTCTCKDTDSLQEAKDQVARSWGLPDFKSLKSQGRPDLEYFFDKVAELYAQSERARVWDEGFWACESSIGKVINPSNPYKS